MAAHLLTLPLEVRLEIWKLVMADRIELPSIEGGKPANHSFKGRCPNPNISLLLVCRRMAGEIQPRLPHRITLAFSDPSTAISFLQCVNFDRKTGWSAGQLLQYVDCIKIKMYPATFSAISRFMKAQENADKGDMCPKGHAEETTSTHVATSWELRTATDVGRILHILGVGQRVREHDFGVGLPPGSTGPRPISPSAGDLDSHRP